MYPSTSTKVRKNTAKPKETIAKRKKIVLNFAQREELIDKIKKGIQLRSLHLITTFPSEQLSKSTQSALKNYRNTIRCDYMQKSVFARIFAKLKSNCAYNRIFTV